MHFLSHLLLILLGDYEDRAISRVSRVVVHLLCIFMGIPQHVGIASAPSGSTSFV